MKTLLLLPLLFITHFSFAQSKLPMIKATSKSVAINDGGFLDKNAWTLSPKAKPDIFTADRTRKTKWVTFYTDIDSIRVKVKPGSRFNFIILLDGKDSCYTQIASAIPPDNKLKSNTIQNDTIPFTLSLYNAIGVKAIINNTDTLNLHFDASSFDFHLTRDAILKRTKLLSNQTGATAPNYNKLNKVFKLQMGNVVWNDPDIHTTLITANGMDGRFGWNLFEGKIVEIDYDHNLLIIHSKLPKALKGYARSKMDFIRSFPIVKGDFEIGGKKYSGNFSMDMGSAEDLILDSGWVAKQNFARDLKLIRSSILRDPQGNKYEIKIVRTPAFRINSFELTGIPTMLLTGRNPMGIELNYLGNDLLKRFNIVLDFKNDNLYLKPNKFIGLKYRENS